MQIWSNEYIHPEIKDAVYGQPVRLNSFDQRKQEEYLSLQNATSFYLQAYEYTNEKLYLEQCASYGWGYSYFDCTKDWFAWRVWPYYAIIN